MRSEENRKLKRYRGKWCVVWRENGSTKRHSLRTDDLTIAEYRYRLYLDQLKTSPETINEMIDTYLNDKADLKSIEKIKYFMKPVRAFFGNLKDFQVNRKLCDEYYLFRGKKDASVRNELLGLRAAIRWVNPKTDAIFKIPSPLAPRDIRITKPEFDKLLQATESYHVYLFLILARGTAARRSAILELTWDRVDFKNNRIQLSVGEHKNKRRALVPMTPTVRKELLKAYEGHTCDYVIEYGSKKVGNVAKALKRTVIRAGLNENISAHAIRHSAASWMAEAGVSMEEIGQYLGHTNTVTTYKTYARFSPDYLANAAMALES